MNTAKNEPEESGQAQGAIDQDDAKYRDEMQKIGPGDLRRIFRQYDADGSGSISRAELQDILTQLLGKEPSDEALDALLQDIDADGSGTIDEDEFLEFFANIENMNQMKAQLMQSAKKEALMGNCGGGLMALNFFVFCGLALLNLSSKPGTLEAQQIQVGFIASGSSLGLAVIFGVIVPMLKHKYGQKAENLAASIQQGRKKRSKNEASKIVELEMKHERKRNRKMTRQQQLRKKADDAFADLPEPPNVPPPPLPMGKRSPKTVRSDQSYRPSIRMTAFQERNDSMVSPKPPALPPPTLVMDQDFSDSPSPQMVTLALALRNDSESHAPPTLPMDEKLTRTSSSFKVQRTTSTSSSFSKRPSSAPAGRMDSFSDYQSQPLAKTGPKGLGLIKQGDRAIGIAYSVNNYEHSREFMAQTCWYGFSPMAGSNATRVPGLSAHAAEQTTACQPDFWDHNRPWENRPTPTTSALPSPRHHQLALQDVGVGHLRSHALALRDVLPEKKTTILVEENVERKVSRRDSPPARRPSSATLPARRPSSATLGTSSTTLGRGPSTILV